MLVRGCDSTREVIALPENNRGSDLMSASQAEVYFKELRKVYIKSSKKQYKPAAEAAPAAPKA
ncbi:MAG: aspartyl-tRNA synthetase [Cryomorphaceae bacterium]|jgi:aspartyl-tRNA synthetase